MRITLDIKDSRYRKFLELINSLDYVSISNDSTSNMDWQMNEVNERLKDLENKPELAIDLKKTIGAIEKKYDL